MLNTLKIRLVNYYFIKSIKLSITLFICFSLPERTVLESDNKALDDSKPTEVDNTAKTVTSDEGTEESGDKNEEKSDDQEKEE